MLLERSVNGVNWNIMGSKLDKAVPPVIVVWHLLVPSVMMLLDNVDANPASLAELVTAVQLDIGIIQNMDVFVSCCILCLTG